MIKRASQLTEHDWICYGWADCTQLDSTERMVMRGPLRTPDEAAAAAREWRFLQRVKRRRADESVASDGAEEGAGTRLARGRTRTSRDPR